MRLRTVAACIASLALGGCVIGYGRCLLLSPMRVSLTGTLHFRTYEIDGLPERVAVLQADSSQYIYAPAQSRQCEMASNFQLTGWSDYPPDLVEGSRITVHGSLLQSTSVHQHSRFILKLRRLERLPAAQRPASH
ncbi:MAG: hypothetical protein KGL34_02135 [Gammaproteobacteria bacterium]|nr:hypothetical protein [Gammaproteobacteria bacterium]